MEDATHRWAKNMLPAYQRHSGRFSPLLNYRWEDSRGALHALRDDTGSPFDGVILEYINPVTGGPSLPTLAAYLQLLRKGERTRAHRHTASTVYHAAEGGGLSPIPGPRPARTGGDTVVLPSPPWHEQGPEGAGPVAFPVSARPAPR